MPPERHHGPFDEQCHLYLACAMTKYEAAGLTCGLGSVSQDQASSGRSNLLNARNGLYLSGLTTETSKRYLSSKRRTAARVVRPARPSRALGAGSSTRFAAEVFGSMNANNAASAFGTIKAVSKHSHFARQAAATLLW